MDRRGRQGGAQKSWIGAEWKEVDNEPEMQSKGRKGTVYLYACMYMCVCICVWCVCVFMYLCV